MPKVSVIMPAYNAEKYIEEAIESILNQTFSDFEFIIINDGSTDCTEKLITSYTDSRIVYLKNEKNSGIVVTLNKGLNAAKGKYIVRMDSDDISLPERLEKQVDVMDKNPDIVVLGGGMEFIGAKKGKQLFSQEYEQLKIDLLFGCCFAHPAVIMRAEYFGEGKFLYDQSFNKMEDYALWVKVSQKYKIAAMEEVVLKYRIHPNQITQNYTEESKRQFCELRQKHMELLGVDVNCDGYQQYIDVCLGRFESNEKNLVLLSKFFELFSKQPKVKRMYSVNLLREYFNSILQGKLSAFNIPKAIDICKKMHIPYMKYILKRIVSSAIAKVGGVIRRKKLQSKLKSKDFSIISNNCWGSFTYQKYGLPYNSPTAGLYILGHDFVKLASNWEWYFQQKLVFIPWENSSWYPEIKDDRPYPVAKLADIEIYFMHYPTTEEAAEKWYRRVSRINPNHMIFKLSQREGCSKQDIEEFMRLPLQHKVCFAYDDVEGTVYVPELKDFSGDEQEIINRHYDDLKILNE